MSKDIYHYEVKNALIKDGWTVTDDPLSISVGEVDFRMDLAAEKIIIAEKKNRKIAVEVKSFASQSPVTEFHSAIGKYDNYLLALEEEEPDRILYLGTENK